MQALAPLLVFALALSPPAQVSEKDRVARETLEAAVIFAIPYSAGVRIVLASTPPDFASRGVEAWTVVGPAGNAEHVAVYAKSRVFLCASLQSRVRENPWGCRRKLASIIVHEAWHFKNGPDEAGAYEAQIIFLATNGASEEIAGVRRARDRVTAREKQAGEEARKRYRERPH